VDFVWSDGSIIAKTYSQKNARFHNPKANASTPTNKDATKAGSISVAPEGEKMTVDDGKMVVEDAEGALMGYMTAENSWLKRGLRVESMINPFLSRIVFFYPLLSLSPLDEAGIKVGRASWSRFSPAIIECEDEYGKKVATGLLQDKLWVVHLSPLASISQHEVSPLFWILASFWALSK
jgi:hypothetical protein